MMLLPEDVAKLLLAVLLGGLIGAEREYRDKAAGFRTIILICVGAALFTIFSLKLGGDRDPVRIAASIVSGVGFLGAGAILRDARQVIGLTTASTIWLAAALGVGVGGGHFLLASVATGVVLVVLWVFPKIELWIDSVREARMYRLVCPFPPELFEELEGMVLGCGLRAERGRRGKSRGEMICTWVVYGSQQGHDRLVEKLLAHPEVKGFEV
mgnify:CR=1 FL=1